MALIQPKLEAPQLQPETSAPAPAEELETGALARAAALRFPDISALRGSPRVEALIDHISATAIMRGELEELRLAAHVVLRTVRAELDRIPTGVTRNRAAIDEAKRRQSPALAERASTAEWVVARCTEQINRMGGSEYDAASRAYTLMAG